jgi:hypothetical protein
VRRKGRGEWEERSRRVREFPDNCGASARVARVARWKRAVVREAATRQNKPPAAAHAPLLPPPSWFARPSRPLSRFRQARPTSPARTSSSPRWSTTLYGTRASTTAMATATCPTCPLLRRGSAPPR